MGPAGWALVCTAFFVAEVPTRTASVSTGNDSLPLTSEELALIEELDEEAPDGGRRGRGPRALLARDVPEALADSMSPVFGLRSRLGATSVVLRGRSGRRLRQTLDGVPVLGALDTIDSAGISTIDPWRLAELSTAHGAITMRSIAPPTSGAGTDLRMVGRSAARSFDGHGALRGAAPDAAVWAGGGYSHRDATRTGDAGSEVGGPGRAYSASGRVRLLDDEAVTVELGFDAEGTRRTIADAAGHGATAASQEGERKQAFIRSVIGGDATRVELTAAYQRFDRSVDAAKRHAEHAMVMGDGSIGITESIQIIASAAVDIGSTDLDGEQITLTARAGGALSLEAFTLEVVAGVDQGESSFEDRRSKGLNVGSRVELSAWPVDELGLHVRFEQGQRVPSVADLRSSNAGLEPEDFIAVSAGPRLSYGEFELAAAGYWERTTDTIARADDDQLENADTVNLAGVDGLLTWTIIDALTINAGGAWTWTDGRRFVPGVLAKASLRYDLELRDAYVEATLSVATDPKGAPDTEGGPFVRVSVRGGVDLIAGIRLDAVVANLLDRHDRPYPNTFAESGVDLRLALSHSW